MIDLALAQAGWEHASHIASTIVHPILAVDPTPAPQHKDINTSGILGFLATKIAPILLAVLGVVFISRAGKGEVSRVLTSSAIAIVGLAFIAGAATLFFVGESLINLVFK